MDLSTITVADFKSFFARDFAFQNPDDPVDLKYIQDSDIEKAFAEAGYALNQSLFGEDPNIKTAYLYLTAHYMVLNLKGALAGIAGGALYPLSSRTVGSVSESYSIPQSYLENPMFLWLTGTSYGLRYMQMALPGLVGNISVIYGATQP